MKSHVFPISANSSSMSFPTRRFATSLIAAHTYNTNEHDYEDVLVSNIQYCFLAL